MTKFVCLILFDNTSEQGGSDVGLIPFICCKGFEVGFLGAYVRSNISLSGVPDYFGRNKISSGGDLFHYSSASLY